MWQQRFSKGENNPNIAITGKAQIFWGGNLTCIQSFGA